MKDSLPKLFRPMLRKAASKFNVTWLHNSLQSSGL